MKIKLVAMIFLFSSCTTYRYNKLDFQGTYRMHYPDEKFTVKSAMKLVFMGDQFANIERDNGHLALFNCCDTIATGSWGIDKERGLIYLNSPPHLLASFIELNVKEDANNIDSLTFIINNPIEKQYKKGWGRKRDISYRVLLMDRTGVIDVLDSDTNYIKIPKPKRSISEFSVIISPKANYRGRNISTTEVWTNDYEIKHDASNVFTINLPELTDGFVTYLRLEKDFIKVFNKNKLEWHDRIYIKTTDE